MRPAVGRIVAGSVVGGVALGCMLWLWTSTYSAAQEVIPPKKISWELITEVPFPTYELHGTPHRNNCILVVIDEGMGKPKASIGCRG